MNIKKLFACFCLLLTAQIAAFAQENDWKRVASDNGEFAIEVPANSNYFFDNDGFTVSDSGESYQVTELRMINAYQEKTLMVVESYRANRNALNVMREKEARAGKMSEIKGDGYKIKQVIEQTPEFYAVKKFFASKEFIYILTAASRSGETPAMKRFFDSMAFKPDGQVPETTPKAVAFSKLKQTRVEIEEYADIKPDNTTPKPPNIVEKITKLAIVSKPNPSFTKAARRNEETGKIRLRVTFAKEGRVSKITILQRLESGLLRQAILAAIRIKFLPQEKDGELMTVARTVEYGFSIY